MSGVYRRRFTVPKRRFIPSVQTAGITGSLSETLAGVTSTASGEISSIGSLSVTLSGVSPTASGVVSSIGSLNETLDGVSSTASGIVGVITGTLNETLEGVLCSASGTIPTDAAKIWFDKMAGRIVGVNDITNSPYVAGEIE